MAKNKLTSPKFNQAELICGWCWWAFQFFLLPSLLHAVNELLPNPLSQAELNFTYFLLNFLAVILIFHRFLRKSFDAAAAHPAYFCQAVILGLVFYLVMSRVINWCILKLDPAFQNANDAFISGLHRSSGYLTVLGTVLLAPIAEECFYRGLLFGTFARKNLWLGYAVSMLLFSAIHILGYIGKASTLTLVLSFLQYLPAGLCLAWSYAKSETILTPIVIHTLINAWGIYEMR